MSGLAGRNKLLTQTTNTMLTFLGINERGKRVYYTVYLKAAENFAKFYGVEYKENYWVGYSYTIEI